MVLKSELVGFSDRSSVAYRYTLYLRWFDEVKRTIDVKLHPKAWLTQTKEPLYPKQNYVSVLCRLTQCRNGHQKNKIELVEIKSYSAISQQFCHG